MTIRTKTGAKLFIFLAVLAISFFSCGGKQKKGVVIVMIDALRRSNLGIYGYERPTSPNIDRLADQGVFFSEMWSAAPQTVPSCASLLTGLYPYRHGAQFFSVTQSYHPTRKAIEGALPRMSDGNKLISEYLKGKNIFTAAISSNANIQEKYGFGQGFDYFHFLSCFWEVKNQVCDGMTINAIFENEVLPKIKGEHFFVYLHYMDVHNPYFKPHSFKSRYRKYSGEPHYRNGKVPGLTSSQLEYTRACYDEGIHYIDEVVGDLMYILKSNGLEDDTLVVITSDHGDELMEHGGLGHGTTCYNELTHSFAIFVNPSLSRQRIARPVSNVDIMPTLLDWLGVEYENKALDGVSLYKLLLGQGDEKESIKRMFLTELGDRKAVIDGNRKYIYNFDTRTGELYNLVGDPQEKTNIISKEKAKAQLYHEFIRKVVRKMKIIYTDRQLTERETSDLRSLGYLN